MRIKSKSILSIIFKFSSNAQKAGILKETPHERSNLVFIRHGQSTYNVACEQYRRNHNIPYIWKELCNHEGFDQTVLFNPQYIDCPLTERGKNQCKKTSNVVSNMNIDCVLVSPQLRALQTCEEIFRNTQIPVFVEPLLVGPLRSCSDVNRSTNAKKKLFSNYDFRATEEYQQLWYLDYLPEKQKQICIQRFIEKGIKSQQDKRIQLVRLLKEKKIYEDSLAYRKRIQDAKLRIAEYSQRFSRICIVSHYYTIQYMGAMEYKQCGTPKYYIDIKNCTPYYACLTDLLAYKQKQEQMAQQ